MPLYEYLCHACEQRFESYVRAFGDTAPCPRCGGLEVERLLSTFAMASTSGVPQRRAGPGGCCGGGCGCAH
jgi:putative FmdB family regulatory protein